MSERQQFPQPSSSDFSNYGNELLELLYQENQDEGAVYSPYNESYLQQLEEPFTDDGWLGDTPEQLSHRAHNFFELLNQQWPEKVGIAQQLIQKFGSSIPHEWLEAIAQQAQEFVRSELSGVEELVSCVQPLLSQWSTQDLQVFARPIAVAMRGQSPELLEDIPAWEQLSPVQQARYTLAITNYALDELKKD